VHSKDPTAPFLYVATLPRETLMSAKRVINDKLQGSVATYLRWDGVINNQIKKGLLLSLWVNKKLKSVNIWQSYKQERDYFVHFLRLLAVCWPITQRERLSFAEAGGFHLLSEVVESSP